MTVVVDRRADLSLENYAEVAWSGRSLRLSTDALERMGRARASFLDLLEARPGVTIYGVTTGYGQHASRTLSPDERRAHAARPPWSLVTAFGEPMPERVTRGIVFARLASYVEGHAAISPDLAAAVAASLDGALPTVCGPGSVSAGEILLLGQLFAPLAARHTLGEKESLALVNGSPCAAAFCADATLTGRRRLALAVAVFALSAEAVRAPLEAYDPVFDGLWADPHEAAVRARLEAHLCGVRVDDRRPYQAPVSWRILPRVLGQAARALAGCEEAARLGLGSVTDNPVYLEPDAEHPHGRVLSNGGYHDARASPALDTLAASWADLALLCDRQVTKLLDGRYSGLPDGLTVNDAYPGCLAFSTADLAERARQAVSPTLLPGSEGGGFGQNDVAAPAAIAWEKLARAGWWLDGALAALAFIASQALHVTGRTAPPALAPLGALVSEVAPALTRPRPLGPDVNALQERFASHAIAPDPPFGSSL